MNDLRTKLHALNEAAYVALRAAKSTPGLHQADRALIMRIARDTDKAVDALPAREGAE